MKRYNYLFGPVPSRRFGRSLGVDLVPRKTCSFDCVFCQVGRGEDLTLKRDEWVSTEAVIEELEDWITRGVPADYITLSGSGEPTLHSRFGEVLDFANAKTPFKSALLTNGTLLGDPEVRKAAAKASVVKMSLSAWDQRSFELINRPHPDLKFENYVSGERRFRAEYSGELWLEVFAVAGINASESQMKKIAGIVKSIKPDRIHLNTAVRPPSERSVRAVPREELERLAAVFDPPAEMVAEFKGEAARDRLNEADLMAVLRRRPCTMVQLAQVTGANVNEVSKYISLLLAKGIVKAEANGEEVYYRVKET